MFRNHLKAGWRNIIRSKGYSALNILGLAMGMAVALLIGLWVYNEYSFDKFLPGYQQDYQVRRNFSSNGDTLNFTVTSLKLADVLRKDIPEIQWVAECDWMRSHGLVVGDQKFYLHGAQIGCDFLKMFPYPLLEGNAATALQDPYSIVLTASTARALFGNTNPLGKTIRYDNKHDLRVTGLLKDLPANSTLQFKFLVPFSYLDRTDEDVRSDRAGGFGDNGYQIFVRLKPGISYAQVAPKIRGIEWSQKDNINAMNSAVILQPLANWHLYGNYVNGKETGGFISYVRLFSIIGSLVLVIACINFINLTTARSEKRAREVGVRKAIGSRRWDLILQFLTESFLLTFLAFWVSLLLVQLAIPSFNGLTGGQLGIPYSKPAFWLVSLSCVVFTALIAGSRPAFYLSAFQPVNVLKGGLQAGRSTSLPRKVLVVLQFSCSVALIISTVIVYRQIEYARERPMGYDLHKLVMTDSRGDLIQNYVTLKNEMIGKGLAENVTIASSPATRIDWHMNLDKWPGKRSGETVEMGIIEVGKDYFKTLGMQMMEGSDYSGNIDTMNVIFNEAAIKRLRLTRPLEQTIVWQGRPLRIRGVVKDALMDSPFSQADPTMFLCLPYAQSRILYRLSPRIRTQEAIEQLTTIFNKYNPAYPYSYEFADDSYAEKFQLEVLIGKLAGIFAGLAIFISCLGLFGLAAYIAEQRTKEIGIRKVLGASVPQVWLLLSKEFMLLVLVSCVIASPLAFYFLHGWLQQYSYRIGIGPGVFLVSAAMAMVITIITISFQAIRAAMTSPAKALKSE